MTQRGDPIERFAHSKNFVYFAIGCMAMGVYLIIRSFDQPTIGASYVTAGLGIGAIVVWSAILYKITRRKTLTDAEKEKMR